ncbi:TPA: hypothetical protein MD657_000827 [Escherichia coli]|nr:hypothetical protein [Escherichia coli]
MEIRSLVVLRSANEMMHDLVLHQNSISPIKYAERCYKIAYSHKMRFLGFIGVWDGNMTKAAFVCEDNHVFTKRLNDCFKKSFGCSCCGNNRQANKVRKTEETALKEAREVAKSVGYGEIVSHFEGGYKGCLVKNLIVICPFHGERRTTHANFIKGTRCRKCGIHGYRPKDPAYFYVQVISGAVSAIKFGITNRDPIVRMKQHKRGSKLNHELVYHCRFDDGSKPLALEDMVKERFKGLTGYVSKDMMKDGYTETLSIEFLNPFLSEVKSLCSKFNTTPA